MYCRSTSLSTWISYGIFSVDENYQEINLVWLNSWCRYTVCLRKNSFLLWKPVSQQLWGLFGHLIPVLESSGSLVFNRHQDFEDWPRNGWARAGNIRVTLILNFTFAVNKSLVSDGSFHFPYFLASEIQIFKNYEYHVYKATNIDQE